MKNLIQNLFIVLAVLGLTTTLVFSQTAKPRPSPLAKIEQEFGLGSITLEYYRPSMKDRKIFGELIPYGQIWRTGANGATKVTFKNPVMVEGVDVPAGTYAVYSIPGEAEWTIMFYTDLTLGGNVGGYDKAKELARFVVKPGKLPFKIETLTINVDNIRDTSAVIYLIWEDTMVELKVETKN
ncbi:MAG: DUF2911 domain-containing protein [Bacteroidia bacterium]|nr:DUF2911 domain-containing protein [Bacteroidia bacterium]